MLNPSAIKHLGNESAGYPQACEHYLLITRLANPQVLQQREAMHTVQPHMAGHEPRGDP